MADFDLVIRNGTVATAADRFVWDLGIGGGWIAALGGDLGQQVLTGIGQSAQAAVSTPPQIIEFLEAMPPSTVQMAPLT